MLSAERIALLKHGAPPRNALEAALRNAWYGGGASYEKTVGPAPIISISDAKPKPAKSLIVGMEPIQDLHGYESPWPAGGGKNLLNIDSSIVTSTQDGITMTVNRNAEGSVTSIVLNGTATKRTYISLGRNNLKAGTILNGCPSGGTIDSYTLAVDGTAIADRGNGSAIDQDVDAGWLMIVIGSGYTANGLVFKPMIRLASVTDDTFAPYSNICPISGRTGVTVDHSGADTSDPQTYHVMFPDGQTVYGGTVDVVSGVLTVKHEIVTIDGSDIWSWGTYSTTCVRTYRRYSTYGWKGDSSCLSNMFANGGNTYAPANGKFGWKNDTNDLYLTFHLDGITDDRSEVGAAVAKWKAFLTEMANNGTPLTISLALYEPQTYQLTPQQVQMLKGANTVWSDADDLTLTYLGTTPENLLGGMLGLGNTQEPTEETSEEPTEGEDE